MIPGLRGRRRLTAWLIVGLLVAIVVVAAVVFVFVSRPPQYPDPPPGWKIISPACMVYALAEQGDHIWAGGPCGVYFIDRRTGDLLAVPDGGRPSMYYVNDIVVDSDNVLWVAHRAGLTRYDGSSWRTFTKADGLLAGAVLSLLEDRDGALWIGTESGVTR